MSERTDPRMPEGADPSIGRQCLKYEREWGQWTGGPTPSFVPYLAAMPESIRPKLEARLRKIESYYLRLHKLTDPVSELAIPPRAAIAYNLAPKVPSGLSPPAPATISILSSANWRGELAKLVGIILAALAAEYLLSLPVRQYFVDKREQLRSAQIEENWGVYMVLGRVFAAVYLVTFIGGVALVASRITGWRHGLKRQPETEPQPAPATSRLASTSRKPVPDRGLDFGMSDLMEAGLSPEKIDEVRAPNWLIALKEFRRRVAQLLRLVVIAVLALMLEAVLLMLLQMITLGVHNDLTRPRLADLYTDQQFERMWAALDLQEKFFAGVSGLLLVVLIATAVGEIAFIGFRVIQLGSQLARVPEMPHGRGPAWLPPRAIRQYLAVVSYVLVALLAAFLLSMAAGLLGTGAATDASYYLSRAAVLGLLVLFGSLFPLLLRSQEFETTRMRGWLLGLLVTLGVTFSLVVIIPLAVLDLPESVEPGQQTVERTAKFGLSPGGFPPDTRPSATNPSPLR
jgi:hypothetical protein